MAWWQWFPWRLALTLLHFLSIRHLTFHNLTALCSRDDWQGSVLSRPTLEGGHLMMSGDVLVFTTRGERMLLPSNGERPGTMQISYRVCSVRYCLAPYVRGAKVEEPNYVWSLDCSCCCHAQGEHPGGTGLCKGHPKGMGSQVLRLSCLISFILCVWCFTWLSGCVALVGWCLGRPEGGFGSPATEVNYDCELPCGC